MTVATFAVILSLAAITLALWLDRPLPPALLDAGAPGLVLLDRAGLPLRSTRAGDGSLRRWVPLGDLDPDVIAAFLAVEDRRFYAHRGVDPRALARAALADIRARRIVSGGSTMTMQLARLLRPGGRDVDRQSGQVLWALRLERRLPKQTILEQYLNRVPLGQGAVGVEAAAGLYFGAHAAELSLGQAALLAGLARAPSEDNPLVSPRRARARRTSALARLVATGYASALSAERAGAEPLLSRGHDAIFAPHFTTRAARWSEQELGPGGTASGTVRTSLDLPLQLMLEAEVRHTVETLSDRGAGQAAVVVLDNATGEVLAWVGSPDFWADTAGQVDMVTSPRQPGSALKPFLYALAFDRGYTPASILPDIAARLPDGHRPVSPPQLRPPIPRAGPRARGAGQLVQPARRGARDRLGVGSLLHLLREAGFVSLGRSAEYYGLGLSLGNGDVTLLELANGYRALANGGIWRPWQWHASAPGEPPEPGRRIATAASAALVLDILDDPVARIPGFGIETPLDFPFPVAAKTGTSRHFTDNWAVATAGGFTVAVWVGNFSGRPMEGVSGVSGAGPLLHRAVLATASRHAPLTLPTPAAAGAVPVSICRLSGLRATASCPSAVEWFTPGTAPARSCDWHAGGGVVLPAEFAEWAQQNAPGIPEAGPGPAPARVPEGGFRILSPQAGDVYRVPAGVDGRYATVGLRAAGATGRTVRWFVDGRAHAGSRWALARGVHRIRAVDGAGRAAEVAISVK